MAPTPKASRKILVPKYRVLIHFSSRTLKDRTHFAFLVLVKVTPCAASHGPLKVLNIDCYSLASSSMDPVKLPEALEHHNNYHAYNIV